MADSTPFRKTLGGVNPRIVMAIAGLAMFACIGGLFYEVLDLGKSAVDLKGQAEPVLEQAFTDIASTWKPETFAFWISPEAPLHGEAGNLYVVREKQAVGTLKSHGPFAFSKFAVSADTDAGNRVTAEAHCDAEFQNSKAVVTFKVLRLNHEWKLLDMQIKPTGPSTLIPD